MENLLVVEMDVERLQDIIRLINNRVDQETDMGSVNHESFVALRC